MAWVALAGCGSSGHDGALAGMGGDDAPRAGTGAAPAAGQSGSSGDGAAAGTGAHAGDGGSAADSGSTALLQIPRVYPLVRAGTPAGLIADSAYRLPGDPSLDTYGDDAGMSGAEGGESLGHIVQERLYTAGPTELLRIVSELDGRTAQLDTDRSRHACLGMAPVVRTWTFPGGQSFRVQLQCLSEWPGGWFAFGFAAPGASGDDAGTAANGGDDFYLVEGQDGGMGGAYRIRAGSGDVEAWITVADSRAPNNSQVIMHLSVDAAAQTTELAFGGSGVGFCSAHLKTGDNYLFIRGKPNAPPPPGAPNGHDCGTERIGCFSTTELNVDLGPTGEGCTRITAASFAIRAALDASFDPEANVMPATIYQFFDAEPQGIPAF